MLKPEILGELDTSDAHKAFINDIAEVVSNHCGGEVKDVSSEGAITVFHDERLPSILRNVWAIQDPEGAGEYHEEVVSQCEDAEETPPSNDELAEIKSQLKQLVLTDN